MSNMKLQASREVNSLHMYTVHWVGRAKGCGIESNPGEKFKKGAVLGELSCIAFALCIEPLLFDLHNVQCTCMGGCVRVGGCVCTHVLWVDVYVRMCMYGCIRMGGCGGV